MMVTFKDENLMTFRHLFLKGYKDHRVGSYALYTKDDVYDHIYYIINTVTLDSRRQFVVTLPSVQLQTVFWGTQSSLRRVCFWIGILQNDIVPL